MRITPLTATGGPGLALKVTRHLARLSDSAARVAARLEANPNPGQLRKADRLMAGLADGQIINHPRFAGNDLIYHALNHGNSINFGHALKLPPHAPLAPEAPANTPDPANEPTHSLSLSGPAEGPATVSSLGDSLDLLA